MEKQKNVALVLDIATLLVIFLVILVVHYPIWSATNAYPFYWVNSFFVFMFIMGVRYLIGVEHSLLANNQKWKVIVILCMVPIVFLLISNFTSFLAWVDEETFAPVSGHLPEDDRQYLDQYIWSEMVLFGMGSILACILLPFRLFISIWRQRQKQLDKKGSIFTDQDEY